MSTVVKELFDEPFNKNVDNPTPDDYITQCNTALDHILKIKDGVLIRDNISYYSTELYYNNDARIIDFVDRYTAHLDKHFFKIKLIRNNIFEQALSNCIVTLTDVWVTYHYTPVVTCTIDLQHFKDKLDMYYSRHIQLASIPADHIVNYNDITGDYETDWNLINFLPKPAEFVNFGGLPNHSKQQTVTNYNELYDWYQLHKSDYTADF